MDQPIKKKLHRYASFTQCDPTDRPIVGCTVENIILSQDYAENNDGNTVGSGGQTETTQDPLGLPEDNHSDRGACAEIKPADINPEHYERSYERLFEIHRKIDSDSIWVASPLPSFPLMEAVFGCTISCSDYEFWATAPEDSEDVLSSLHVSTEWIECFLRFSEYLSGCSSIDKYQ